VRGAGGAGGGRPPGGGVVADPARGPRWASPDHQLVPANLQNVQAPACPALQLLPAAAFQ